MADTPGSSSSSGAFQFPASLLAASVASSSAGEPVDTEKLQQLGEVSIPLEVISFDVILRFPV